MISKGDNPFEDPYGIVGGKIVQTNDKHSRQFIEIEKVILDGDNIISKKIYRIVPQLRIEKDRMVATMVVEEV